MINTSPPPSSSSSLLVLALALSIAGLVGAAPPPALFVFGDSYADTGNHDVSDPQLFQPWRAPYGRTWPGKPAGRFSDGMILTDFIARFINVTSPVPFREAQAVPESVASGVNFAFGGSGVFSTYGPKFPNISTQIDQFDALLKSTACCDATLSTSFVLFVYAGNDYGAFVQRTGKSRGILFFIPKVVSQISSDLQRLYDIGLRKFAVTTLAPTGCLPVSKRSTRCNRNYNLLCSLHNQALFRRLSKLKGLAGAQFITLDNFSTFRKIIASSSDYGLAANSLQPCCQGIGDQTCGSVDSTGKQQYTVCSEPEKAFFWDGVHPTQAGWSAVSHEYQSLFSL